jgi:hypothetical protein
VALAPSWHAHAGICQSFRLAFCPRCGAARREIRGDSEEGGEEKRRSLRERIYPIAVRAVVTVLIHGGAAKEGRPCLSSLTVLVFLSFHLINGIPLVSFEMFRSSPLSYPNSCYHLTNFCKAFPASLFTV